MGIEHALSMNMKVVLVLAMVLAMGTAAKRTTDHPNCAKWLKPAPAECEVVVETMAMSPYIQRFMARICPVSCPREILREVKAEKARMMGKMGKGKGKGKGKSEMMGAKMGKGKSEMMGAKMGKGKSEMM